MILILAEFRSIDFLKIQSARDYEIHMQQKNVLLIAQYLSRSKGGGAESKETLLEHLDKKVETTSS